MKDIDVRWYVNFCRHHRELINRLRLSEFVRYFGETWLWLCLYSLYKNSEKKWESWWDVRTKDVVENIDRHIRTWNIWRTQHMWIQEFNETIDLITYASNRIVSLNYINCDSDDLEWDDEFDRRQYNFNVTPDNCLQHEHDCTVESIFWDSVLVLSNMDEIKRTIEINVALWLRDTKIKWTFLKEWLSWIWIEEWYIPKNNLLFLY